MFVFVGWRGARLGLGGVLLAGPLSYAREERISKNSRVSLSADSSPETHLGSVDEVLKRLLGLLPASSLETTV